MEHIRKLAKACRDRGCRCIARCHYKFNRWWAVKAEGCDHPNWFPEDTACVDGMPPFVGTTGGVVPDATAKTQGESLRSRLTRGRLK